MRSYADCKMLVCREYHSLTMISMSVDCVSLMTPMLLLTPQISSLLQSMLHMEVVLGMHLSKHGKQSSPMLQQLLKHADRCSISAVMLQLRVSLIASVTYWLRGQHKHMIHFFTITPMSSTCYSHTSCL